MSRLSVYYGEGSSAERAVAEREEPLVFSFSSYAQRGRNRCSGGSVNRARILRENDRCPRCDRGLVEPLELADALRSRNNLPIPGTATLVAFHCAQCHWEWPA